jgi:hypothetical protein
VKAGDFISSMLQPYLCGLIFILLEELGDLYVLRRQYWKDNGYFSFFF